MSDVTYSTKCYTYVCAGCNLLSQSDRRDQLTCSPACRVKAHRNGSLKALRQIAEDLEVRPARVVQMKAIMALCPNLYERIKAGEKITIDDAMPETNRRFVVRLIAQIKEAV